MASIRWMEADDPGNPFKIRIFNCLSTAMGLLSATQNPAIAAQYNERRRDDGRSFAGRLPAEAVEQVCDLQYPAEGGLSEGPLHVSREMEDKWDVYLYTGRLYFVRSWTGDLVAAADIRLEGSEVVMSKVWLARAKASEATYAVRFVDFLIKSHLLGWRPPHPIPADTPNDPQAIAMMSFSLFGRHGFAATFEDTLDFRGSPKRDDGTMS